MNGIGMRWIDRHGVVRRRPGSLAAVLTVLVVWSAAVVRAREPGDGVSPAEVKSLLDRARESLDAGRPAAASAALGEAAAALREWADAEKPPAAARSLARRAESLRDEVELQGGDVSAIELPEPSAASARSGAAEGKKRPPTPPAARKTRTPPGAAATGREGTVSFADTVAPLLGRHCGGCHVAGRRGDFQFTSYDSLMKSGMVQKGEGAASRLVEVIRTGDMPRGGGRVSPEDLALLQTWIDEGAVCDTDPVAPLGRAPTPAAAPPSGPVELGPGDVSFAFEVAPILVERCAGCHDATQPDGNLSMVSLASLVRGGANGAAVQAGEGASSLLVRKIKGDGIEGQRMPLGKTPLADDVIATIEKWIDQGAKLDLLSADAPLDALAAAGRARRLPHGELRTVRFAAAEPVWRLAIPDEEPSSLPRGDLLVLGNLAPERLEAIAAAAEAAETAVREFLVGGDSPLVKGGVVLLAFAKPYDYSGHWENVQGAERPKGLSRHAGIRGDLVFAAMVAPATDSPSALVEARAAIAEELGAAAFLARGAPEWFAVAAGRAVALKVAPKSALAKETRGAAVEALAALRRPAMITEGKAPPATVAAAGGMAIAAASAGGSRLRSLAERLDAGTPFDEAFAAVFQAPPAKVVEAWAAREGRARAGAPGR